MPRCHVPTECQGIGQILTVGFRPLPDSTPSTSRFVIAVLPLAIVKWLESYNQDRGKFAEFVERYDTVVSEARLVSSGSSQVDGCRIP